MVSVCKPPGVRVLAPLRSRAVRERPEAAPGHRGESMGLSGTEEGGRAERDVEKMEGPPQIP